MNKLALKILVGIIATSLAVCAGFFSIVGLSKLFAGAMIAVIAMASTLEASKLVIASFLYQSWETVSKALRFYLLLALIVIASITSIGIYGFLSGAYQTTKSKYDLTKTVVDSLSAQKNYYQNALTTLQNQTNSKNTQLVNLSNIRTSQENRAAAQATNNRSSYYTDQSSRQTDASIKQLNLEIDNLNKKTIAYTDSVSKMEVAITQAGLKSELSSELGSLVYISNVLNVPMDKVVNVLIILFIIVFDPLAICMVLVFNFLNKPEEILNLKKEEEIADILVEFEEVKEEEIETPIEMPIQPTETPLEPTELETQNTNTQENVKTDKVDKKPSSSIDPLREQEKEAKRRGTYPY